MFTGIVTDVGLVLALERPGDLRARIASAYDPGGIDLGASIACDGVCLTVVATGRGAPGDPAQGWFEVQVSAETLARSNLGAWAPGRAVNLERALRVGDELGGHIVSGHVDGLAQVIALQERDESLLVAFRVPTELAGYIAPKGSVCLNGTSLTVNEVAGPEFGVNLIPHPRAVTPWAGVAVGDEVNLEVDTLARYVARLQEWGA